MSIPPAISPLVTVIILAYQQPAFLNEALASVARQTHPSVEIVIIDDASGRAFTEQYLLPASARLIVNDHRRAVAAMSRNIALQQARGEYVAFLDQDDLWLPEKLAIQVAALQTEPKALLHFTHYQCVDARREPLSAQEAFIAPSSDPLSQLLRRNVIACSSVMMRRSAFETIGRFDESIRGAADWDMWLRVAAAGRLLADSRELLLRRHHDAQWSKSGIMLAQGAAAVIAKAAGWVPKARPDLRSLVNGRQARWLREIARVQLEAGVDTQESMTYLRRSARISPLDPRTYGLMWRAMFARHTR